MSWFRQDHDYDEEHLQNEAGDGLRYGDDFDLDTTDTEAPEHYDLDGYEDEGAGPREGGDYSPAHGTPGPLSPLTLVPTPALALVPLAEGHQAAPIKVGDRHQVNPVPRPFAQPKV